MKPETDLIVAALIVWLATIVRGQSSIHVA